MELGQIKARWTEVLDALEAKNRMAWIAYFDARLSELNGNALTLDFSDSRKFATSHEYSETRPNLKADLVETIHEVLGITLEIIER
ncbi:MAG: hypothetical protein RL129_1387 [Actinomycetota bacterium]|mgnify:FL=1|jgi:hypothetical protein